MPSVVIITPATPQAATAIGGQRALKKTITDDYTLIDADSGYVIMIDAATDITITVTAALPDAFYATLIQKGLGTATLTATGAAAVRNVFDLVETGGQWSIAYLVVDNPTGAAATAIVTGALQ